MLEALDRWQNDPLVRPSQELLSMILAMKMRFGRILLEVHNALFCHLEEKLFHTVVLKGVTNISGAHKNPPMKFLP